MAKILALIVKIKNLIPAILGILQTSLPAVKEIIVAVSRLCSIIFFWTDVDEKIIEKINKAYVVVFNFVEKIKNWLLGYGFKIS